MIISVKKSQKPNKKYVATFKLEDGTKRSTHFGQKGSKTYLDHKDKSKREAYRKRHAIDLETDDAIRPGYLSYYLLWGDHTNLKDAVKAYNKRFFGLLQF
ncbi:MAG: hypothetical protein GY739_10910 [Mesoflavibacter sp.]|nr:hypothetical protein [Mesoflavibacter sp.]